nr:MAG TPA: hypothetical protein [Caudoviricetes sp.]
MCKNKGVDLTFCATTFRVLLALGVIRVISIV